MKKYEYSNKALITFFILVVALSTVIDVLYCKGMGDYLVAFLMWVPAFSSLIANVVNCIEKNEKFSFKTFIYRNGFNFTNPLFIAMAVLIPFVYLFIPYRIYWTMYPNNYAYTGVPITMVLSDCFLYTVICVVMGLLTAAGEEIGWRGFMLPALKERFGENKSLIVSSLIWCLWHFPLLIWGGYMEGTPLWYSLISFVLCIFPVGIICGLLRIKSNSMWPCAFLHAAHNAYDQSVFAILTRGDNRMFFVSETGIFTIICAWTVVFLMYLKYKKDER